MKKVLLGLPLLFFYLNAFTQKSMDLLQGKVSFISSQNIYVKFPSTAGISQGDTLFINKDSKSVPALIVRDLSSASCACIPINNFPLSTGDIIIGIKRISRSLPVKEPEKKDAATNTRTVELKTDSEQNRETKKSAQKIRGSLSAISYSNFANKSANNSNQFRYNLSLNLKNPGNSKISAETYISFRHKAGSWDEVKKNIFNSLKIYNLVLNYDPSKSTHLSIGRKINPEISGIGAVDGIQGEQVLGKFSIGALAGFRPDYTDFGFNSHLLQYGGWLGFKSESDAGYLRNTIAIVEQRYDNKTDRRFISYNLSSSLAGKISFLGSLEADLYELKDSLAKSTFNPTSLYFSLRYRITDNISLSGSYDARKNVIYYETYKSFIDLAIENEMRKSFRFGANFRITDDMVLGIDAGYRFLKSDPVQSKNANGYFTYSNIPLIKITATLSYTYLESAYLNGKIYGVTLSRDLFNSHLQINGGYRYIDYNFMENLLNSPQNIAEAGLNLQILKTISFSANYELTMESSNRYNRLYILLRKRF